MNSQNQALWEPGEEFEDQYLVVSSSDGGVHWSHPRFVVGMEDGSRDYPINVDGRQTLTGYQVRVWGAGNIVAEPDENGHLYLVFSDNRNGVHDSDNPVTNSDVFVVSSTNGGQTWTAPTPVDTGGGDQWFPWADVNPVEREARRPLPRPRRLQRPDLHDCPRRGPAGLVREDDVQHAAFATRRCRSSSRPAIRAASSAPPSTATTSGSPTAATAMRTWPGRTCAIRPRSRPGCSSQFIYFARK